MDGTAVTDHITTTLRSLQSPDDIDGRLTHALINQEAEKAAVLDLHNILSALGVLSVEAAMQEIKDLQATARTFSVMVRNMSMDATEWEEYQLRRRVSLGQ